MTTATPTDLSFRDKIFDVREQRRMARPLEVRSDRDSGQIILEGYAATFGQYDVYGGPKAGGWIEQIHNRAFDKTLGTAPDVQLLVNHDPGYGPLARTKSGTLQLSVDSHGLLVRASLDPSDPDVQRLMPKMRRGDMDEMSFAFRVAPGGHEWDSSYTTRTITEINLQKGDVSVVNYGMNPNTAAMLSTEAVAALAQLSSADLMELRSMDRDQVKRAMAVLQSAVSRTGHPSTRAKAPGKYSEVSNFADPGYLDSSGKPAKSGNGVKRYPLNTAARVRNAAARFAQNKGRYSSAQQSAIMGKIRSAAKKFGVEISDEAKGRAGATLILSDGVRQASFTVPYVWDPLAAPIDPHNDAYDKEELGVDDNNELADGQFPNDTSGTALKPRALRQSCEENCDDPDHDHDEDRDFGGKKAKPFGGDDDDEDEDRADLPDVGAEMGDYEGDDAEGAVDDYDETEDEHEVELSLVSALESTIVSCYQLAKDGGHDELRAKLAQARRQISDIRGDRIGEGDSDSDVAAKLSELRSMTGDLPPDLMTVSEGLRALSEAGFADSMQPKIKVS